ncbi:MAG: bifunctional folylpolyglutamate synthase/dihydrofolate synthase [Thermomicrobiales bacterium]
MAIDISTPLEAYHRAQNRLLGLISGEPTRAASAGSQRQRAQARLAHTRKLLTFLGDPQRQYPTVYVTGTSGKGSTSAAIAAMLTAAGFRVGLRTSPYLQVATEKLQIGPRLIAAESLDDVSSKVLAAHEQLTSSSLPTQRLGYAEAWSVMTLLWFAEQQIDAAVVEVGAGGRFDATNVFDPAVSVITSIGLDHVAFLGPTLGDIAWHKAGIIKPGATAVVGVVPAEAWTVIEREVRLTGSGLVRSSPLPPSLRGSIGMFGAFQETNAAVAVAAIDALRSRGIPISETAVRTGLSSARMPGRLEHLPRTDGPTVWVDGAHNADKINALASELRLIAGEGPLPVVVLGVLGAKDAMAIASGIGSIASAIVATEPDVVGRKSLPAPDLAAMVRESGFKGPLHVDPDPLRALLAAETMARSQQSSVLVTGSLYLAGHVRRRWYPDADIIVQRTPWPEAGQALPDRSVALYATNPTTSATSPPTIKYLP